MISLYSLSAFRKQLHFSNIVPYLREVPEWLKGPRKVGIGTTLSRFESSANLSI